VTVVRINADGREDADFGMSLMELWVSQLVLQRNLPSFNIPFVIDRHHCEIVLVGN
jgi:hypothetical protein